MLSILCLKAALLMMQATASQDVTTHQITSVTSVGKFYCCPRCRRARPPGPRKRSAPQKKTDNERNG